MAVETQPVTLDTPDQRTKLLLDLEPRPPQGLAARWHQRPTLAGGLLPQPKIADMHFFLMTACVEAP